MGYRIHTSYSHLLFLLLLYSDAQGIEELSALIEVTYFSFTETKKQRPNTGARANYTLHT